MGKKNNKKNNQRNQPNPKESSKAPDPKKKDSKQQDRDVPVKNRDGNEKNPPSSPQPLHQQEVVENPEEAFARVENWDEFYSEKLKGDDVCFDYYVDWPRLRVLLPETVMWDFSDLAKPRNDRPPGKKRADVKILVPGCGNSRLSENVYDSGFKHITSVDISEVVISYMSQRNSITRKEMKWRVMDMTSMQPFPNGSFDVVLDKGGLDTLMEPRHGPRFGNLYLSEVKRILVIGGKFICVTSAEPHVIDLLFHKFRLGWKMNLHAIDEKDPAEKPKTYVVVVEKDSALSATDISPLFDKYSVQSCDDLGHKFHEALEKASKLREKTVDANKVLFTLEELGVGALGNIAVMDPGRRIELILGEPGVSKFSYKGILLDAEEDCAEINLPYAVIVVPHFRAQGWLYTSEEGQWFVSANCNCARILLVLLDSSNSFLSLDDIKADIYPLAKQLSPDFSEYTLKIPIVSTDDGIVQREIVHRVASELTGEIIVEDVRYNTDMKGDDPAKHVMFRRLTFQRTENLVQSEVLLSKKRPSEPEKETTKQDAYSWGEMEVDNNMLVSTYHYGIISGILLISSHFSGISSRGNTVRSVILGLGGGALPMFMKRILPCSVKILVVELDEVVLNVARDYFGFEDDENVKVYVADGVGYIKNMAKIEKEARSSSYKIDILVVDADSPDPTSGGGLSNPGGRFVDNEFLVAANKTLSENGLFIINLISWSSSLKAALYARLKKVFGHIYRLKIEEDVNEVVFAMKAAETPPLKLDEARTALANSLGWTQKVVHISQVIKPLS